MKVTTNQGIYYISLPIKLYKKLNSLPETANIDKTFLALLLHFILMGMRKDSYNGSGWINLHSEILSKHEFYKEGIRYRYKPHIELLEENGIISTTKHTTLHGKSKAYKITEEYLDKGYQLDRIALHPKLSERVRKNKENKMQLARLKNPELTKWLEDPNFVLDDEAALEYTCALQDTEKDEYKRIMKEKAIAEFENISYSRDGNDDRLHNNYTSLSKDLRKLVRYKGAKMVSFDIKSSQPFLLSTLLQVLKPKEEFVSSDGILKTKAYGKFIYKKLSHLCKPLMTNSSIRKTHELNKNYIDICLKVIVESIVIIMSAKQGQHAYFKQINKFHELVINGDLYLFAANRLQELGIIEKIEDKFYVKLYDKEIGVQRPYDFDSLRECGKTITFNAFYSGRLPRNRATQEYKKLFPEVFEIADAIKGAIKVEKEQIPPTVPSPRNILAILLQRMEAKFILDYCAKRIAKKHPNMPLITIHDSIVTTASYAPLLKVEFEKCMQEYFSITVELLPEPW